MDKIIFNTKEQKPFILLKKGESDRFNSLLSECFSPSTVLRNKVSEIFQCTPDLRKFLINRLKELSLSSDVGNVVVKLCGGLDTKSLGSVAENIFLLAANKGWSFVTFTYTSNLSSEYTTYSEIEGTEIDVAFKQNIKEVISEVVSMYGHSTLRKS